MLKSRTLVAIAIIATLFFMSLIASCSNKAIDLQGTWQYIPADVTHNAIVILSIETTDYARSNPNFEVWELFEGSIYGGYRNFPESGTCEATDTDITLDGYEGEVIFPYILDGDSLKITDTESGKEYDFTRLK